MKLLYISNSRTPTPKAHGYQIMKMCQTFAEQKVELELIVPTLRKVFKKSNSFDYYKLEKNFKLKKVLAYDPIWLISIAPQGWYIKFQAFLFMLSLFFYLLFKKNKAEYIFYTRDEYLLPLLQFFSNKVVWEGHSLPRRKKYYQKYFKNSYCLIVLTQQLKNKLIKLDVPADKILVSADAVDLEIFDVPLSMQAARQKLNLTQDEIILGYSGSFKTKNMDKGLNDILAALEIVNQTTKNIFLLAIGGSQQDINYYQDQAEQLKLSRQVLFLEKVDQTKLVTYQKACDILLMPFPSNDHYAYFMSPLKMFEYMASQRPLIATHLASLREILDEKNAILIKPDSPKDLAQAINKLIKDKELGQQLARQAFKDVQKYTWQKRAQSIIKFIYGSKN